MLEIMNSKEAAEYLRTSQYTLKARARAGLVPAAKFGREWRFRKSDLDEWLAAGGDDYEARVDEGLAAVTNERMLARESTAPLAEVEARLRR